MPESGNRLKITDLIFLSQLHPSDETANLALHPTAPAGAVRQKSFDLCLQQDNGTSTETRWVSQQQVPCACIYATLCMYSSSGTLSEVTGLCCKHAALLGWAIQKFGGSVRVPWYAKCSGLMLRHVIIDAHAVNAKIAITVAKLQGKV